jgi:hypothetical protein
MANPSKSKGTLAESALVKYLHSLGVEDAKRQPLSGNKDIGDVLSHNGSVVWEVKNYSGPASVGQPPQGQLAQWVYQTDVEAANAGAAYGVLVVKRKGTTDVGMWFAYWDFASLAAHWGTADGTVNLVIPDVFCTTVRSMVEVLRRE